MEIFSSMEKGNSRIRFLSFAVYDNEFEQPNYQLSNHTYLKYTPVGSMTKGQSMPGPPGQ